MKSEKALLRLLMEAGFLAADYAMREAAEKIFSAVKNAAPDRENPIVGQAFIHIANCEFDQGIALLKDEALKLNPDSEIAKAYIGLALRGQGKLDESDTLLKEVVEKGKDPAGVAFAKTILQEIVPIS